MLVIIRTTTTLKWFDGKSHNTPVARLPRYAPNSLYCYTTFKCISSFHEIHFADGAEFDFHISNNKFVYHTIHTVHFIVHCIFHPFTIGANPGITKKTH